MTATQRTPEQDEAFKARLWAGLAYCDVRSKPGKNKLHKPLDIPIDSVIQSRRDSPSNRPHQEQSILN